MDAWPGYIKNPRPQCLHSYHLDLLLWMYPSPPVPAVSLIGQTSHPNPGADIRTGKPLKTIQSSSPNLQMREYEGGWESCPDSHSNIAWVTLPANPPFQCGNECPWESRREALYQVQHHPLLPGTLSPVLRWQCCLGENRTFSAVLGNRIALGVKFLKIDRQLDVFI